MHAVLRNATHLLNSMQTQVTRNDGEQSQHTEKNQIFPNPKTKFLD